MYHQPDAVFHPIVTIRVSHSLIVTADFSSLKLVEGEFYPTTTVYTDLPRSEIRAQLDQFTGQSACYLPFLDLIHVDMYTDEEYKQAFEHYENGELADYLRVKSVIFRSFNDWKQNEVSN